MGQKVNPHGLRVGVIKDWESRWFADDENFSDNLVEDYKIREFLKKKLYHAGISKIEIERTNDRVKVLVYTAKPGVVIGKGGSEIENSISFRRAKKYCMGRAMKAGAKGIKTSCSGRLGGADMARTEFYSEGNIPLQTLRADIDYGFAEANTTYGKIGVKTWIYHGEVLPTKGKKPAKASSKEGSDK